MGTAAFTIVLATNTTLHPIFDALLVTGTVKDGDSHQCKLSGIYGIVTLVHYIAARYMRMEGALHVACNNKQALHIFDPDFLPNPNQAYFDLLNALYHLILESPITWMCKHVWGHQDSKQCYQPLSVLEQLNVQMDKLAEYTQVHYTQQLETFSFPPGSEIFGEGWQLWQGMHKIMDASTEVLYSFLQDAPTQMWWTQHGHLSPHACENIDWDGTQDMMDRLSPAELQYSTKHASSKCGVGETLV